MFAFRKKNDSICVIVDNDLVLKPKRIRTQTAADSVESEMGAGVFSFTCGTNPQTCSCSGLQGPAHNPEPIRWTRVTSMEDQVEYYKHRTESRCPAEVDLVLPSDSYQPRRPNLWPSLLNSAEHLSFEPHA